MGKPGQTPIWEIRNSEKAMEAVQQTDDQHILAKVVMRYYQLEPRLAALEKIHDQDVLNMMAAELTTGCGIFTESNISLPLAIKLADRDKARLIVKSYISRRKRITRSTVPRGLSSALVMDAMRVLHQSDLKAFAFDPTCPYSIEAACLITDQDVLAEYILQAEYVPHFSPYADERRMMLDKITNRFHLQDIARSCTYEPMKSDACKRLGGHTWDDEKCSICGANRRDYYFNGLEWVFDYRYRPYHWVPSRGPSPCRSCSMMCGHRGSSLCWEDCCLGLCQLAVNR